MNFIFNKILYWILKFLKLKERNSSAENQTQDRYKSSATIQMLPNEILSKVLEHLNERDLIQCFNTTQKLREIARYRLCLLKQPDTLQMISKQYIEQNEIFSTLHEDRSGGILICMPNGMYVFGGINFSHDPFPNNPITSKFFENESKEWKNGPIFPHHLYPQEKSIHDYIRDYTSFEFSAGHKVSKEEFIVVMNRHIFKYNVNTNEWCYIVKLKYSRRQSSSLVFNEKLVVAGGYEIPHENILTDTEIVDLTARESWIAGHLNIPRVAFKMDMFVVEGLPEIGAYGGNCEGSENSQLIEIWHEKLKSWKILTKESANEIFKMSEYRIPDQSRGKE